MTPADEAFELHPRLLADTTPVGDLPLCRVLLAREDIGPWLILVPRRAGLREIHHMADSDRDQFMVESAAVATLLETAFGADNLNIAALGNLVPQLHVHHVARFEGDAAWPAPIWGNTRGEPRDEASQAELVERIAAGLERTGLAPARSG